MKKKVWILNHYATNTMLDHGGRHYWFAKYLTIEAKATSDNGAIIDCPRIEKLGFEYRRIEHQYVFKL